MENLYRATKLIGDAYAKFIKDASPEVEAWLVHKLRHTFGVAHDIMDIFYGESKIYELFSPQERRLVEEAGILHDLGRFYQHKDGKHLSGKVFDHGAAAVKMLQDNPYFNDKRLLFAIYEHNRYKINYDNPMYLELSDADKTKADIMAKLVRDADKLENMRSFIYYDVVGIGSLGSGTLSESVRQDLINHDTISHASVKNDADSAAIMLSWINDINFKTTAKKLQEFDFIDKCIKQMPARGASQDDIKFLRDNLNYHINQDY